MRVSQQIGWSQESKLIYQIIKQTERINQLLPGNQAAYNNTPVSRMIGWSNEANLYYEWLRSLDKLTQHYSNCCTTTTTTTGIPPFPGTINVNASSNFDIPEYGVTGDFTIEWWMKMASDDNFPRVYSIGQYPANNAVSIEGGTLYFWGNNGIVLSESLPTFLGEWHHIAIVRAAAVEQTLHIYFDGVRLSSGAYFFNAIPSGGLPLQIGSEGNTGSNYNGLLSNFRWTSSAVYENNFTPPTSPLSSLPETKLLLFQGDTLPLELTDNSGLGNGVTNSNIVYNSDNPFVGYSGSVQFGTV